jgi:hypothetical protein
MPPNDEASAPGCTAPQTTKSPRKYSRVSNDWKEGDFEVITSDSVRFVVHSHYLFYARYGSDVEG